MKNEKLALKLCAIILLLAGVMDIIRGFTHTFRVRYAAEYLAGIETNSDNLVLMSAFGISNLLTGLLFFLILWEARNLAPYVLFIIPVSYSIGSIGMGYSNVTLESEFKGQYIMTVYLSICLIAAVFYFVVVAINKNKN